MDMVSLTAEIHLSEMLELQVAPQWFNEAIAGIKARLDRVERNAILVGSAFLSFTLGLIPYPSVLELPTPGRKRTAVLRDTIPERQFTHKRKSYYFTLL